LFFSVQISNYQCLSQIFAPVLSPWSNVIKLITAVSYAFP
jgi:hypothetical protein